MEKIIVTERLWLREFNPGDAESFYLLNLDPEVIKFTGDDSFKNIEEAEKFLLNYDHYKKYVFGRWAVMSKTDNSFLGWCGLKYIENIDEYDIGFRFFKKYWRYGYATESAKACLELGFKKFNIPVITGRALKENTASIHVLKKIGLTFYKDDVLDGKPGVIYRKSRFQVSNKMLNPKR